MTRVVQARIAPGFGEILGVHDANDLDRSPSVTYGIWSDGRLAYMNRGWFDFARKNDGEEMLARWDLDANVWQAIKPPLRAFYEQGFQRCLEEGKPWGHAYECSSPENFRKLHMLTYPLGGGRGFLIVNSLELEVAHEPPGSPVRSLDAYVDENGMLVQCMHCRRMRRRDVDVWDWIPDVLRNRPRNMTGGLCEPCFAHHYPAAAAS